MKRPVFRELCELSRNEGCDQGTQPVTAVPDHQLGMHTVWKTGDEVVTLSDSQRPTKAANGVRKCHEGEWRPSTLYSERDGLQNRTNRNGLGRILLVRDCCNG